MFGVTLEHNPIAAACAECSSQVAEGYQGEQILHLHQNNSIGY